MKHSILKYTLFCFLSLAAFSCVQEEENEVEGIGTNRFRVPNSDNYSLTSLDAAKPTGAIFTVYRDVVSNSDLNQPATLTFSVTNTQLETYNSDYEEDLIFLDPSLYTLEGVSGNSIEFAAGEAQKSIGITVKGSLPDFENRYAVPFTFTGGTYEVSKVSPYVVIEVGVKNKYDGVYAYTGTLGRYDAAGTPLNDGLDGATTSGLTVDLATTAANEVSFSPLWASGGGVGGVGSPHITINADNSIVLTPTGASPVSWGPIPGTENKYDPATKTFYINYKWGAASGSPTGTQRSLRVELKFKSSR